MAKLKTNSRKSRYSARNAFWAKMQNMPVSVACNWDPSITSKVLKEAFQYLEFLEDGNERLKEIVG